MNVDPKKYENLIKEYVEALESELGDLETSAETIANHELRKTE